MIKNTDIPRRWEHQAPLIYTLDLCKYNNIDHVQLFSRTSFTKANFLYSYIHIIREEILDANIFLQKQNNR